MYRRLLVLQGPSFGPYFNALRTQLTALKSQPLTQAHLQLPRSAIKRLPVESCGTLHGHMLHACSRTQCMAHGCPSQASRQVGRPDGRGLKEAWLWVGDGLGLGAGSVSHACMGETAVRGCQGLSAVRGCRPKCLNIILYCRGLDWRTWRRLCCIPRPQTWQARAEGGEQPVIAPARAGARVGDEFRPAKPASLPPRC
jgi:hypothetical protein